jgi:hypothetical protein
MNVAMYVIRKLEESLTKCKAGLGKKAGKDATVGALDEAVAYYTGALEGTDGSGSGNLMYNFAEKRCANFKTCGLGGNELTGASKVNFEIFDLFDQMQRELSGRKAKTCAAARMTKEKIVSLMFIPIIQGALRYAYIGENRYSERAEAEAAAFAAAVLPMVAACDEDDAGIIYTNMKVGQQGSVSFAAVSGAFSRQYGCLGITCEDVGGLWDSAGGDYFEGASPCAD